MEKLWSKIKAFTKKHWIGCSIILFAMGPLLLNLGLYLTDVIYDKYGLSLKAKGLDNKKWFNFWGTYLSVLIAFVGICVAWKSSDEDRKKEKRENKAKEYGEHLEEEKHTFISVCQSFNTDIIHKSLLEWDFMDAKDCKRVLQSARQKVLDAQVEFELLTDVAEDFQKCENCDFNPCIDKMYMIAIRDFYFEMENLYLELLQKCNAYIENLENQRSINNQIQNREKLISLLKQQILSVERTNYMAARAEIKKMEEEILHIKSELLVLEEQRTNAEKLEKLTEPIVNSANLISQDMKPKLINYSKLYINQKKRHKEELVQEGKIQYVKYRGLGEMPNYKN